MLDLRKSRTLSDFGSGSELFSLQKNIRVRNFLITGGCGPDEDEGLEGGGGAAEGASAPLLASSPVQDCVIN